MYRKLRDICSELNISRRTIQGYEKMGLVAPARRNKYGHLLYGEREKERIRQIRFYQKIGFSLKEIPAIWNAPREAKRAVLQQKLTRLEAAHAALEDLIRQLRQYMDEL